MEFVGQGNWTLEELDTQIKDLQARRKALAKVEGIPTIVDLFSPFFDYPIVKTVEWKQYTPFWNDGEPCEFNVYYDLGFNGDPDQDDEHDYEAEEAGVVSFAFSSYNLPDGDVFVRSAYDDRFSYDKRPDTVARRQQEHEEYQDRREAEFNAFKEAGLVGSAVKDFKSQIKVVEKWLGSHEDFLLDAFGDHVKVTVSRDGVEVEEYDHG